MFMASMLVRQKSARFRQTSLLTFTRAVTRSEQIEARRRRNPEAYAVYVEGFRRLRTKRCEAYRHGISLLFLVLFIWPQCALAQDAPLLKEELLTTVDPRL